MILYGPGSMVLSGSGSRILNRAGLIIIGLLGDPDPRPWFKVKKNETRLQKNLVWGWGSGVSSQYNYRLGWTGAAGVPPLGVQGFNGVPRLVKLIRKHCFVVGNSPRSVRGQVRTEATWFLQFFCFWRIFSARCREQIRAYAADKIRNF